MHLTTLSTLDRLRKGVAARVDSVDWDGLDAAEARRLRELGLVEGAEVEVRHRGALFFRDPLAVRVGRMRIIMRARHAMAITLASSAERNGG